MFICLRCCHAAVHRNQNSILMYQYEFCYTMKPELWWWWRRRRRQWWLSSFLTCLLAGATWPAHTLGLISVLLTISCAVRTPLADKSALLGLSLYVPAFVCFVYSSSQSSVECHAFVRAEALPSTALHFELCTVLPSLHIVPPGAMPGKCCKCICAKSDTGCVSCMPGLKNLV